MATGRSRLAGIALVLLILTATWTVLLSAGYGLNIHLLGVTITAHEPRRPLALALIAGVIWTLARGPRRTAQEFWRRASEGARAVSRIDDRVIVATLAVCVVAAGVMWGSKAAGGADSYGYISQAGLWLRGEMTIQQPWADQAPWPEAGWTFAPLGYVPGHDQAVIVPKYAAGLPLLMALAAWIAGQCAVFWVTPLSAGVLVLATFGIARRLGLGRAGLAASWLVATSPIVLFMTMAPMSDVPVAAAWAVCFWCLVGGRTLGAGLAAALAILIRPNLAPMAALPVGWLIGQRIDQWRAGMRPVAAYLAGAAPGVATVAYLNLVWYGSPLRSGYETIDELFSASNVLPNLKHYIAWLADTQTPLVVLGVAALIIPATWLWPTARKLSGVVLGASFVLLVFAEYSAYSVFDAWWYLRFLLPCFPFIMIGLAVILARPARGRPVVAAASVAIVLLLGLRGVWFAVEHGVLATQRGESKYPIAAGLVRARTDANAVVFSVQHSGSVRYYAGRMTLNFSLLQAAWLDRAAGWLAGHGAHPFALLEQAEVNEFRERFGATNVLGRLEMGPVFEYSDGSTVYLYDLLRPASDATPIERIVHTGPLPACPEPAPRPDFRLSQ